MDSRYCHHSMSNHFSAHSLELGHALDCLDDSVVRDNADKISLTFSFHHETSHCRRHLGEVEFGYTEVMGGRLVWTAQGVSIWPI